MRVQPVRSCVCLTGRSAVQHAHPKANAPAPARRRSEAQCCAAPGTHRAERLVERRAAVTEPLEAGTSARPEREKPGGVLEGTWMWRDYRIRYQRCGDAGPAVVLIHGFGGNCDHWKKNIAVLGLKCRTYSLDLLGYGWSDKPDPRLFPRNELYCFETWAAQVLDFVREVVGAPAFLICNSVGGIVGLQAAVDAGADTVAGVQLLDVSLRMLHVSKQAPWQRPLVAALQRLLRDTPLGTWFFSSVARPQTVKNILRQCYGDKSAVTDELVSDILTPGLQPGAAAVFLDFVSYSSGPLPEDLLPRMAGVPVSILWGEKDPWEPIELGRAYADFECVEEFVALPGADNDDAPLLVNPAILRFVERHSGEL